jgi:hypothetical protein
MLAPRRRVVRAAILAIAISASLAPAAHATTFTVSNLTDADPGSLRDAVAQASAAGGADDIAFAPGLSGTINLQSRITVSSADLLTIAGPGADLLSVRRANTAPNFPVLETVPSAALAISGLTIANGTVNGPGGGVRGSGTLVLERVALEDNLAFSPGGAVSWGGQLTVRSSTFSGNVSNGANVSGPLAGAIRLANGQLEIANSTIVGNTASNPLSGTLSSGGILADATATTTIENSTIAGNTSARVTDPANILAAGPTTITSTIVANPLGGGPSCGASPGPITSGGFNVDSAASCSFTLPTDSPTTNPVLGPLTDNGGPTATMAPGPSSPVLDAGSGIGLATDQRGVARVFDLGGIVNAADGADVGAVELHDSDLDGVEDGLDLDDDNDSVADAADSCPLQAGQPPSGCPASQPPPTPPAGDELPVVDTTLRLRYSNGRFKGRVRGSDPSCISGARVKVMRRDRGPDSRIGKAKTSANGKFAFAESARPGKYYATLAERVIADKAVCTRAKSKAIAVG